MIEALDTVETFAPSHRGPHDPIRVLFIAGWGRSGSTLLDRLLGLNSALTSVGEIKFLWSRGLQENRACGCGVALRACSFWQGVLARAVPDLDGSGLERLVARESGTRTRHLPGMLAPWRRRRFGPDLDEYRSVLAALYRAVLDESGARIVVDSSKFPSYLFLLQQVADLDVRVVHLVRDPRAVAHSWSTETINPDLPGVALMPRRHPVVTSLYWSSWNLAVARVCTVAHAPRLVVRYENLARRPDREIARMLAWSGVETEPAGFIDIDREAMRPSHTVSGNPAFHAREGCSGGPGAAPRNQHREGCSGGPGAAPRNQHQIAIRLDERWRRAMEPRHQWMVWALTAPVRGRFGYRS